MNPGAQMDSARRNTVYRSLQAIALGDSLGASTEFQTLDQVVETWVRHQHKGWPFVPVGEGTFGWAPGDATDDASLARAMADSWIHSGGSYDGEEVAARFLRWSRSHPLDIGGTTHRAMRELTAGTPWWQGGRGQWLEVPHSWSNGSLMRNGVIAAMAPALPLALRWSLLHGLITHWAPLPAICCAAQTWLLHRAPEVLDQELAYDWREAFRVNWEEWLAWEQSRSEGDPQAVLVLRWLEESASQHAEAWRIFLEADFDPDHFRPYRDFGPQGYCLLSFQIGVWAMQWALRGRPYPPDLLPAAFPTSPFERKGCWVLGWVAMIGRDAATYGAIAGPLIAGVAHFPGDFLPRLQALEALPFPDHPPRSGDDGIGSTMGGIPPLLPAFLLAILSAGAQ